MKPVNEYCCWWLVFYDKIVVAPKGVFGQSREKIQIGVRGRNDTKLWSMFELVSQFQFEQPPPTMPKWFRPLWENPQCTTLPDCPC